MRFCAQCLKAYLHENVRNVLDHTLFESWKILDFGAFRFWKGLENSDGIHRTNPVTTV